MHYIRHGIAGEGAVRGKSGSLSQHTQTHTYLSMVTNCELVPAGQRCWAGEFVCVCVCVGTCSGREGDTLGMRCRCGVGRLQHPDEGHEMVLHNMHVHISVHVLVAYLVSQKRFHLFLGTVMQILYLGRNP